MFAAVIKSYELLREWRKCCGSARIACTNGCFDVIHRGHIDHLAAIRDYTGAELLVVGLNGDESVRKLKGPGRPVNNETDRARVLAAMRSVDLVFIFPELRAANFIEALRPHVYVKGGDYSAENMDASERAALLRCNSEIRFLPRIGAYSTTAILAAG